MTQCSLPPRPGENKLLVTCSWVLHACATEHSCHGTLHVERCVSFFGALSLDLQLCFSWSKSQSVILYLLNELVPSLSQVQSKRGLSCRLVSFGRGLWDLLPQRRVLEERSQPRHFGKNNLRQFILYLGLVLNFNDSSFLVLFFRSWQSLHHVANPTLVRLEG